MRIHAPYTANGVPVLGTYVAQRLDDLQAMRDVGMNLVIGGHEHLDTADPRGRFCLENGIKVMHHLTNHIYGRPRLRDDIAPEDTTIPLSSLPHGPIPPSGIIALDDELIRYASVSDEALHGCERGIAGTNPSSHRGGAFLFWPEEAAAEIRDAKGSPNLWGYYVLDDSPGEAISALRALYRTAKAIDPDRPVCAGFGGSGAMLNFGPGVCDVILIYWYPVNAVGYNRLTTSEEVQWIMTAARSQVPGIPFMGIYQTFDAVGTDPGHPSNDWKALPTADQVREQMEDFVREGACGLIAFHCHVEKFPGWLDYPHLHDTLRDVHREIRETGGLTVHPEPPDMAAMRVQPTGYWREPNRIGGYPPAWWVLAPFAVPEGQELAAIYPPETEIDLAAVYPGKHDPIRWRVRRAVGGVVSFVDPTGGHTFVKNSMGYATCIVSSPRRIDAQLRLGTDEDAIVWMNGEEIFRHVGMRGIHRDENVVDIVIPSGPTRFLFKVYNRVGMWGFAARFTDRHGKPIDGLVFDPTERDVR